MVERDFSIDVLALFMFLYIAQVLPIIFPLKLIYSQIAFYTKHFVLTFSIDVVSSLSNCPQAMVGIFLSLNCITQSSYGSSTTGISQSLSFLYVVHT